MSHTFLRVLAGSFLLAALQTPALAADPAAPDAAKPAAAPVPVIGQQFDFVFGPDASYRLSFVDAQHLVVTVLADPDPDTAPGSVSRLDIAMTEIRPDVYMVTWVDPDTGSTVTQVEDFANRVAYANTTNLVSEGFARLKGEIRPVAAVAAAAKPASSAPPVAAAPDPAPAPAQPAVVPASAPAPQSAAPAAGAAL